MSGASRKMGFNATWSMAVGGMVGGGIFSVLGLVVSVAGAWAWASLLLAGLVALATGWSYSTLARRYGESGGAFTFLREAGRDWLAGSLSWMLIGGYVLTIAVYAFTFGHYLGAVTPLGAIGVRVAAVAIVLALLGVNLIGVGEASWLEIVTVWGKLAVLLALAVVGLWTLDVPNLSYDDATPGGGLGIVVGAASIFMAYEGFQLLTYDYDDMRRAKRTLPLAIMTAIGAVIVVYVLVAVGSASLVGAAGLVEKKEVALAAAGEHAAGLAGKIVVSVAATFSTASAINATLFATARLARTVAEHGELPGVLAHETGKGIPDRALILLGATGAAVAATGGLSTIVEGASLAFLFTFCVVNVLAVRHAGRWRWVSVGGAIAAGLAGVVLAVRLAIREPWSLAGLGALIVLATVVRPLVVRGGGTKAAGS